MGPTSLLRRASRVASFCPSLRKPILNDMESLSGRLPNGLLIILHLHLLDYPLQDATGYDERLFDSTRGMRERNKATEDISYFLVGKIERSKDRAKAILPTYPCLQPSDTTAFRIALAKYIEATRNSIVHTTHASEKQVAQKGKQLASSTRDEIPAWWWKDVVVRKSILEECCGERFERLILALSTHAILRNISHPASTLHPLSAQGHAIPSTLPKAYTVRLAAAQSERLEWERSAALLVQRQADLAVIRARLADPRHASSSKYNALETARLIALRESRHQDLLRGSWRGDDGRRALQLVTSLAGLIDPVDASTTQGRPLPPVDDQLQASDPVAAETPPPLPIAAARHPSYLHALDAPLFPAPKNGASSLSEEEAGLSAVPHAITERLAVIGQVQRSLQETLLAVQSIHAQLQRRMVVRREKARLEGSSRAASKGRRLQLDAGLWAPRAGAGVVFKSPEDAAPLLSQFGLESPLTESAVEERIAHIRTELLSSFVAEPLPVPEPAPEVRPPVSRLPQLPSRSQQSLKVKPATLRHESTSKLPSGASGKPPHLGKLAQRVRLEDVPHKIAHVTGTTKEHSANAVSRRLSRRASMARTRRSTVFGRGGAEDAEILRIVASVQDHSDSEGSAPDEDGSVPVDAEPPTSGASATRSRTAGRGPATQQPRTPARSHLGGTRGTLLSASAKQRRGVPRASYDIDVHERAAHVPRLPSLRLGDAPELEEEEAEGGTAGARDPGGRVAEEGQAAGAGYEEVYEGNSMTLADILLYAGHHGRNVSVQLLEEDELEDDMPDW
ncbi:hypothetical protein BC628DRAFT_569953 [Trametes gibbosa]|nr:hypothetical protein BC628DRAFT_569953 [Trametes gibbosa]